MGSPSDGSAASPQPSSARVEAEVPVARQSRSTLPGKTELPGAVKTIPPRALGLSVAALAAAMWGAFSSPDILAGYDAVSWLLLLVPVFLFAYYRGWQGATRALAVGSLMIIVSETGALFVLGIEVEWFFLLLVAAVLVAVGIGLGILSELLERERLQALSLAYADPVTGLPNRRLLDFMLDKASAGVQWGHPFSIVLFDVDRLDTYNRRHSYAAGDDALRLIAACLKKTMRPMHTTGRYGGSRFLSLLSGENMEGASAYAEKAREAIADLALPTGEKLSVRAGIAAGEEVARIGMSLLEDELFSKRVVARVEQPNDAALRALLRVMSAKALYLKEDAERGANISDTMARYIGVDSGEVEEIRNAALLRDIGMICTPDSSLQKNGPLTAEERESVKKHVTVGAAILLPLGLGRAAEYTRYHHERIDGSGYPEGRTGDEIPLGAQIVGLADSYCALTAHRPFRPAISPTEAIETLRGGEGLWFRSDLLNALESAISAAEHPDRQVL